MKKKSIGYFLSFFIPIIILILWLLANNIIGSKSNVILLSDMYHQYTILFDYIKDIFNKGLGIYSFSKALGGNMIGTIAYYLMSPFNIITLFFNQANMHYACIFVVLIKLGLCGTTMYIYLKNTFKSQSTIILLMFSTCYALSMYNVSYFFNVMWFDGVMLAPLLLLGIDRIIEGRKPILYGIILFLTIITNYYIGYIMCIFAVIYFCYKVLLEYHWKEDKKRIIKLFTNFIITSLLSGFMTMVILIPMYVELKDSMRYIGSAFTKPLKIDTDIFGFLSEFLVGISHKKPILNPHTFLLYTGIINFILTAFYFFNKKIEKREKILSLILLGVFIVSFMINYVNYIWHGLAVPVGFNGRYTFLFSFMLIYFGVKSFINLDGIKKLNFFALAPVFPIVGLVAYIKGLIDIQYVYISVGLFLIYLVILYLINHNNGKTKKQLIFMLVFLTFGELFFNANADLSHYELVKRKVVEGKYADYNVMTNYIKEYDDSLFYRLYYAVRNTHNDPLYFDYFGTEVFLSSINKRLMNFYNDMGCFAESNTISYTCHNYMLDAILNVKYLGYMAQEDDEYNMIHQSIIRMGNGLLYGINKQKMDIYENPYALSLGYMVNSELRSLSEELKKNSKDSISYQNLIYKLMSDNHSDLIEKVDLTKIDNNKYSFTNTDSKNFFIAIAYKDGDKLLGVDIKIEFNNNQLENTINSWQYNAYFKNVFQDNEEVTINIVTVEGLKPESVNLYYFDMEKFKEVINELKQEQMDVVAMNGNYLKGTINVTTDKTTLFTSIPYEKGWTIKVDNKQVEYYSLLDTFIGIDLIKGEHTIEFEFMAPGIKTGLIISIISLGLFILYFVYYDKLNKIIFKSDN